MLDRLRGQLNSSFTAVGRWFSRLEASPTAWTLTGLVVSLMAAVAFSSSGYGGEVLGGALILAAGWFDIVDGAVARVTGRTSNRGAFLDSTLDRVAEVALFSGLLLGGYAPPMFILAALASSLLVSYTRAKGDALGVSLSGVGIGERSERLLIIAVGALIGQAYWGVVLVIVVATFTFLERTFRAVRALK